MATIFINTADKKIPLQVLSVPEPSAFILVFAITLGFVLQRRRSGSMSVGGI